MSSPSAISAIKLVLTASEKISSSFSIHSFFCKMYFNLLHVKPILQSDHQEKDRREDKTTSHSVDERKWEVQPRRTDGKKRLI